MKPLSFLLAILLPLAAHAADEEVSESQGQAGLANPASEYCVSVGGEVEIRTEKDGEVGYCHLPDGRVVEEWELFRAEAG